jgi:hypothetical protein
MSRADEMQMIRFSPIVSQAGFVDTASYFMVSSGLFTKSGGLEGGKSWRFFADIRLVFW